MEAEVITKEDLQVFRIQLLEDLKKALKPMEPEQRQEWVKSGQVRKMLNVSHGTLQNLRINGKLHPKKIGGVWYYNIREINSLFNQNGKV